jgi:hypothetical protein
VLANVASSHGSFKPQTSLDCHEGQPLLHGSRDPHHLVAVDKISIQSKFSNRLLCINRNSGMENNNQQKIMG